VLGGEKSAIPHTVAYGHPVDEGVSRLMDALSVSERICTKYPARWAAVKLIEKDDDAAAAFRSEDPENFPAVQRCAEEEIRNIERHFDDDAATIIAERRYGFAAGVVRNCLALTGEARQNLTDAIDGIVCNRAIGPMILFSVVTILFFCVFRISDQWTWIPWFGGWLSPTGFMAWLFESLSRLTAPLEETAPMLHSLLNDGIISGVGGVMGFVPLIFTMFFFISFLEDTGYIARVAFILDRVLQFFGLQGKSILPMIVAGGLGAGGCAVPGIMATRVLREEKDRLVTMLVTPFMNCGAKLPVYAMLISAFFANHRTLVMLSLWGISWITALVAARVLRRFVIRGEQTPFVMELPPYHLPSLRSVLRDTGHKTWMYIRKAGTVILAINIILWAAIYFPRPPETESGAVLTYSAAGRLGRAIEPVSQMAGFDWRTNIALIGGFAAKELVVGTLGTIHAMDATEDDHRALSRKLSENPDWNPLKAFTLMIFVMLYSPCMPTIAVIRRESGGWYWALFATVYATATAFVFAILIYQAGSLAGLGG
jgi:ferrous iron transport protein B